MLETGQQIGRENVLILPLLSLALLHMEACIPEERSSVQIRTWGNGDLNLGRDFPTGYRSLLTLDLPSILWFLFILYKYFALLAR